MVDDLGTGLMVKGHLELDVGAVGYHNGGGVNGGNGTGVNNRNSYIGLAGESWGEVRFGTQENIHEATGYAVDPFHGAAGPGGNIVNGMGQSGIAGASQVFNGANIGARRTDSTITYISPNWSGFTFQVDYALEGPSSPNANKWNELFYGARYDGQAGFGGWRVYGAGADISNAQSVAAISNQVDMSGYRLGGGLTFGNFAVDAIYETNEWKDASAAQLGKVERDGWWLGGSWMIPTGKVALGYIMMNDRDENGSSVGSSGTSNLAVGYYHTLSANSSLYVIYNTMDNDTNASGQIQNTATLNPGEDPAALSLGMYLVF